MPWTRYYKREKNDDVHRYSFRSLILRFIRGYVSSVESFESWLELFGERISTRREDKWRGKNEGRSELEDLFLRLCLNRTNFNLRVLEREKNKDLLILDVIKIIS